MKIQKMQPAVAVTFSFLLFCFVFAGKIPSVRSFGFVEIYPFDSIVLSSGSVVSVSHQELKSTQIIEAEDFVRQISDKAIAFLSDSDLSQLEKQKKFEVLLERHFDLNIMGKYALGRYWRVATPAEREEYNVLFQRMVIDLYSQRFSEYSNQHVEVDGAIQKGKNILVRSKVIDLSGSDIELSWVVKRKNGEYRVIDLLVEGVSMVITQRSDFSSVIQRGGGKVQVLIERLKP